MCSYCGNRSGLMDSKGGCVSCGAPMEYIYKTNDEIKPRLLLKYGGLVEAEKKWLSSNWATGRIICKTYKNASTWAAAEGNVFTVYGK